MKKHDAAIFDLDGTLFNDSHRKHLVESKQWDQYFHAGESDEINPLVLVELKAQIKAGRKIIIMTGCPEKHRAMTEQKLKKAGVSYDEMLMRPDDNFSKNHELKSAWVASLSQYRFLAAFDDMQKSFDVFRAAGIRSFIVKDGKPVYEKGKAPKAGKKTGRKKGAETKVITVRLPVTDIEKYYLDGKLLKLLITNHIKKIEGSKKGLECKHNTEAGRGEFGICLAAGGDYPIIPGDCPCEDYEKQQ